MNTHDVVTVFPQNPMMLLAGTLVTRVERVRRPVAPVNCILEDGKGERVEDIFVHDDVTFQGGELKIFQPGELCIAPVEAVGSVIQRKAIGPTKISRYQLLDVCAVRARMHDSWPRAPVCPVNGFLRWVYDDRSRRIYGVRNKCAARSPICCTHQDAFYERVRDVKVVCNPIQGKVFE